MRNSHGSGISDHHWPGTTVTTTSLDENSRDSVGVVRDSREYQKIYGILTESQKERLRRKSQKVQKIGRNLQRPSLTTKTKLLTPYSIDLQTNKSLKQHASKQKMTLAESVDYDGETSVHKAVMPLKIQTEAQTS